MGNTDKYHPINGRLSDTERNFGQYFILEKIGEGGIGEVYRVMDSRIREIAVLKILRRDQAGSALAESRFMTEIEGCSRINHPNIIRALDSGKIDGKLYYVMRHIDGKTLKQMMQEGIVFEEDQIMMIMETVARALGHVHRAGIIHCDIKPDNIMLDKTRQPVVIDFGLSVDMRETRMNPAKAKGASGYIIGTPVYMAPEQIRGNPSDITPAVDVYGVGVTIFELLCGQLPFPQPANAPMMELITKVVNNPPIKPSKIKSSVSPLLEELILKCLEKSPAKRFASSDDLAVALNNCRRGIRFANPEKGLLRKISGFFLRDELKPKKPNNEK